MSRVAILAFIGLVVAQILFIVFLAIEIQRKGGSLTSLIPLNKDAFQSAGGTSKWYYEPKPYLSEPLDLLREPFWLTTSPVYTLNSEGFNNAEEFKIPKPAATYRVITLGDSFTFGQFVDTRDAWPSVLQRLMNELQLCRNVKTEVLNLGVPGYDIQYATERFISRGQKYDADLVIWFIKNDDFLDLAEAIKDRAEAHKSAGVPDKEAWEKAAIEYSSEYPESKKVALHREYLKNFVSAFRGNMLFVTFPFTDDTYKKILRDTIPKGRGYLFDGLSDIYAEHAAFPDKHPTAAGHRTIAEDINDFLGEAKVVECP